MISEGLRQKLKGVVLDLSSLKHYRYESYWIEKAVKKIEFLRKAHPDKVDSSYEAGFKHGYVEARVDALEEN